MSKLDSYNGTIDLISGLRAKNNGDFPLMQAHDVQATETQRLDEMFKNPESWLPVYDGENEGGAEGGGTGGGITKTKVTLAELQSMLTEENVGAIVEIIPKQIVSADETMQYFVASGLLPIECVISRTQSGYSTLKSNSFFTYKDETTYTINQLSIGLYKDLAGNTILALYRVITVANGNVTNETTDMVEYVSDDAFDFYIYK